jgi:hypothetical protein
MGKVLRFIGIVFMGLTSIFTILGGAGTTCVALAAERWDSMAAIAPYKWLYVLFVLFTTAIGVLLVRATVLLVRGRPGAYRQSVIWLVAAIVIGVIHIIVSRSLRGSSMPVDPVTYTAVITLVIFLLFRIPGVWQKVNFDKAAREADNVGPTAAAITLVLSGLTTLSVQVWAGPSHTFEGANWADAWNLSMSLVGWGLILVGLAGLVALVVRQQVRLPETQWKKA